MEVFCRVLVSFRGKEKIHSEIELIINSSGTVQLVL